MDKLIDQIKDMHKLHCVTKDFNHIIEYQPGSWKMFEPSKFVYAYFAFNSFYNYNWADVIEHKELVIFSDQTDGQKYKAMIDFIFNQLKGDSVMFKNVSTDFVNTILAPHKTEKSDGKYKVLYALEGITPDIHIEESDVQKFKKEFKKLLDGEVLMIGKLKEIVRFVSKVRNNIFHGTKDVIKMTDRNQRIRLDIYSNFLIAINDLLFKSLENALDFELDKRYNFRL